MTAGELTRRALLGDLGAEKAFELERYDAARTITAEVTR
jgi:hypothetical protein